MLRKRTGKLLTALAAAAAMTALVPAQCMAAEADPLQTLPDTDGWKAAYTAQLAGMAASNPAYSDDIWYWIGAIDADADPEMILSMGNPAESGGFRTMQLYTYKDGLVELIGLCRYITIYPDEGLAVGVNKLSAMAHQDFIVPVADPSGTITIEPYNSDADVMAGAERLYQVEGGPVLNEIQYDDFMAKFTSLPDGLEETELPFFQYTATDSAVTDNNLQQFVDYETLDFSEIEAAYPSDTWYEEYGDNGSYIENTADTVTMHYETDTTGLSKINYVNVHGEGYNLAGISVGMTQAEVAAQLASGWVQDTTSFSADSTDGAEYLRQDKQQDLYIRYENGVVVSVTCFGYNEFAGRAIMVG